MEEASLTLVRRYTDNSLPVLDADPALGSLLCQESIPGNPEGAPDPGCDRT